MGGRGRIDSFRQVGQRRSAISIWRGGTSDGGSLSYTPRRRGIRGTKARSSTHGSMLGVRPGPGSVEDVEDGSLKQGLSSCQEMLDG